MTLSFRPETLPVVRTDGHLPAVPRERLVADWLTRRFLAPPEWVPEIVVERRFNVRSPAPAAVLIPLVQRDEPMVLLTRRSDHLHDHPGQVSFPGGRVDPGDADAVATALREAEEEIGLQARYIHVLGALPLYTTSTGFEVTPVVALVDPSFELVLDNFEVAEVFEVPLAFLMTPAHHRWHAVEFDGVRREFLSMPWDGHGSESDARRFFIWGATAAMLRNFYRFLAA